MPAKTFLKSLSVGAAATVFVAVLIFVINLSRLSEFLLYEAIPFFSPSEGLAAVFKLNDNSEKTVFANNEIQPEQTNEPAAKQAVAVQEAPISLKIYSSQDVIEQPYGMTVETVFENYDSSSVVGSNDISVSRSEKIDPITVDEIERLKNLETLQNEYYSVDALTKMTEELFDVEKFVNADLKIDITDGLPKVLIVHTHSQESFVGSDPNNKMDGVVGLGAKLAEILYFKYGIVAVHNTKTYDIVNGESAILGAYERLEPDVKRILDEYPSVEIVIDIHRDGIADETVRLVTEINGKPTAKLMFFNGLSQVIENGKLTKIVSLPNPYVEDNLAFSFNLQLKANQLYPGLARKMYLRAYRYSLHYLPKSMLVEIGAQNNTKEEAFNAMEPLAEILASVILEN